MTGEVAVRCPRNNYLQSRALSLAERAGVSARPDHRALSESLEARGQLQRPGELLPDDATLDARADSGKGLTRPELSAILAYAKNSLYADLLDSPAPDDAYLSHALFNYFPPTLVERYRDAVLAHRLKREVIATVIANAVISRGGPAFVVKMMAATSPDPGQVAAAFILARDAD